LYASFYYVLGQYNTTLSIIDHVLSRCAPDMMVLRNVNYTTNDIKYYKQNVGCSKITLNEKIRLATIDYVNYVKQSTLIPHELKDDVINVHVMLRFAFRLAAVRHMQYSDCKAVS
jgi:hypothetical protein